MDDGFGPAASGKGQCRELFPTDGSPGAYNTDRARAVEGPWGRTRMVRTPLMPTSVKDFVESTMPGLDSMGLHASAATSVRDFVESTMPGLDSMGLHASAATSVRDFVESTMFRSTRVWFDNLTPGVSTVSPAGAVDRSHLNAMLRSDVDPAAGGGFAFEELDLVGLSVATVAVLVAAAWIKLGMEDRSPQQVLEGLFWLLTAILASPRSND